MRDVVNDEVGGHAWEIERSIDRESLQSGEIVDETDATINWSCPVWHLTNVIRSKRRPGCLLDDQAGHNPERKGV